MPNVNAVLNEQIRRLARREIRANTKTIKRAGGNYRRDIAALKRQVRQLTTLVMSLQKQIPDRPKVFPGTEGVGKARLRIDGLKSHRARLGISAMDYGKLIGVSALTIYNWEAGKSKPRRSQLPQIVAVRGIGKREAMERLGLTKNGVDPAYQRKSGKTRGIKPGTFSKTGEESILSLLKGRKALTTRQINEAWKKEGRGGTADGLLGKLVKAKRLQRNKVEGQRGSEYRVA